MPKRTEALPSELLVSPAGPAVDLHKPSSLGRFGWDCHGLPVEYEIDKKLNIKAGKR